MTEGNQTVEEARRVVVGRLVDYVSTDWRDHGMELTSESFSDWEQDVDALIEAVRQEERERAERFKSALGAVITGWKWGGGPELDELEAVYGERARLDGA